MRHLKRYIGRSVWEAILTVLLVIVALDVIAGLVDELGDLQSDYTFSKAAIYIALKIPSSVYEFLPLSSLVGCLIGLGVHASSSELVVMRAAGVSINQIIWAVFRPVFIFIILGALIGEYVAPYSNQYAESQRALALGHQRALESDRGVWNREGNEFMHFNAVLPNGKLFGVTRFRFDDDGELSQARFAESAIYQGDYWFEQNVKVTHFNSDGIEMESQPNGMWRSEVSPSLLNVLVPSPEDLPMQKLYNYASYLSKQNLDASEHRLVFWQKALQPLATLSLVMIAISFILGPLRQVTMGFRVFIGVIVGLIFQMSQKLLGPSSIIWGFSPVVAVCVPILMCFMVGVVLVRRSQ
ncbi:LPS export ABC transporter permease LptG [Agarilytica rhodophyticola]|uniref:LPS export ABC transporter permease LptG n=1 Tax=Agarilytica rhodophyticola TaxID=1737490 RepID=UPI000B34415D|nr:LPS export ABC transporter permease LptG [Agarilytica rhodophyticola]